MYNSSLDSCHPAFRANGGRGRIRNIGALIMRKRAFTLIELLVVIAIIAILAAILFPVFAQAKVAAKKASDLSNTKQLALCANIYITDTDDILPVAFTNISGGVCLPNDPTVCGYRSMWQFHMYPYLKNWTMLTAPGDSNLGSATGDAFNLSYGYNYGYLSTLCVQDGGYSQTKNGCPANDPGDPARTQWYMGNSATSINRPANIVMFADSGGKDFTSAQVVGSLVNPPDAWPSERYFYGPVQVGWGKGCSTYWAKANNLVKSGKWGDTDGFAPRFAEVANVTFVDSHSASRRTGQMASGTIYNPNVACTVMDYVNDYSKYQWDPRYDSGVQRRSDQ